MFNMNNQLRITYAKKIMRIKLTIGMTKNVMRDARRLMSRAL